MYSIKNSVTFCTKVSLSNKNLIKYCLAYLFQILKHMVLQEMWQGSILYFMYQDFYLLPEFTHWQKITLNSTLRRKFWSLCGYIFSIEYLLLYVGYSRAKLRWLVVNCSCVRQERSLRNAMVHSSLQENKYGTSEYKIKIFRKEIYFPDVTSAHGH